MTRIDRLEQIPLALLELEAMLTVENSPHAEAVTAIVDVLLENAQVEDLAEKLRVALRETVAQAA